MRKLFTLIMSVVLVFGAMGLTACGNNNNNSNDGDVKTYDIKVWVGEFTDEFTREKINLFNETKGKELGVRFNATVGLESEKTAMGTATSKPESCADLFCIAQDSLARGVSANLLAKLNSSAVEFITANNDEDSVAAATIGNTIRAFPMTADNGIFMYYDKRVVKEEHLGDLDAILDDVEAYKDSDGTTRNFSIPLDGDGGGWYAASFFYGAGCKSEWTTNENGGFTGYDDTFDSDAGIIALRGMHRLLNSTHHINSSFASDFSQSIPSAVVISGIWEYRTAKEKLGEYLGIAPLPSYTVDGQSYPLVSYLGRKLMCLKEQSDGYKLYYLQELAKFLTDEQRQTERFELVGWGPSNKAAAANASSDALDVLKATKTTPQGQYPSDWWSEVQELIGNSKGANESVFHDLLSKYSGSLSKMKTNA